MPAERNHQSLGHSLARHGFIVIPGSIPEAWLATLRKELETVVLEKSRGGLRQADKKIAAIGDLVRSQALRGLVADLLAPRAKLVRVILFDKTPINNWHVGWHQDTTIAVSRRANLAGWGPWSVKDGVPHVQPPTQVLEQMLTLRLHLDDAPEDNACLRVIPGSHRDGVLAAEHIAMWRKRCNPVSCPTHAGDVLAMRPLLLHASQKAHNPTHRRVVHAEFCAADLPAGLSWA
jgi:hypothetical protein